MLAQVSLTLTGPLDHLRLVWQTGETLLAAVAFDEDPEGSRYQVLLALQELVTNVLRHGYRLDQRRPIEVVFGLAEDHFEVLLRDEGPAFDPLGHDTSELPDGEQMLTESGGFGIHIVKLVMDRIDYARVNNRNELRLVKFVRAAVGSQPA
jgi:serine/threonine-protein kinase RsbW